MSIRSFQWLEPAEYIGSWNLVGFAVSLLLITAVGFPGRILTKSPWGWSVGALPVLVGTLHGWEGHWVSGRLRTGHAKVSGVHIGGPDAPAIAGAKLDRIQRGGFSRIDIRRIGPS